MLACSAPNLVSWRPDFSTSGQASPNWTKLLCDEVQLCNSIEWTEWLERPLVQVELCEQCGYTGCATGGYARISRLADHVLWTPPRPKDVEDAWEREQYTPSTALSKHGAVAIAVTNWAEWRERFPALPSADEFPRTERGDLAAAWTLAAPFGSHSLSGGELVALVRERVVAAEPSTTENALRGVEALVAWLASDEDVLVEGGLGRADERDSIETLYLDMPDGHKTQLVEWRPYAVREARLTLAFGDEWNLRPAPLEVA
jgi:hypothetical protein